MMPSTLQLLRADWIQSIALWQLHEDETTLYRAIAAERKYTFAWRRYRHLTCHGRAKVAVKTDIGWVAR